MGQAALLRRAVDDGSIGSRAEKITIAADRCARIVRNFLLGRLIFLTGDVLSPEMREFLERTEQLSLGKPFTLEEVRRVVQQALRIAENVDRPAGAGDGGQPAEQGKEERVKHLQHPFSTLLAP